jgi:hypothetical protein
MLADDRTFASTKLITETMGCWAHLVRNSQVFVALNVQTVQTKPANSRWQQSELIIPQIEVLQVSALICFAL